MEARSRIAVTGATGRVGTHIVDLLDTAGHEVVPISRSNGVDVITGEGLAGALEGVDCIIDAATGPSPDQEEATAFFTTSARSLQEEGAKAGVKRIVVVSIIGVDKFTDGYNAAKLAQEQALAAGPIPVFVLRAAQFHEFVGQIVEWSTQGDVSYVPKMRTQLIAARSVAEKLVELATSTDGPALSEIAGPREETMSGAAKLLTERRGDSVKVEESDSWPGGELVESDALLPGPDATLAGPTFEEWLDSTTRPGANPERVAL